MWNEFIFLYDVSVLTPRDSGMVFLQPDTGRKERYETSRLTNWESMNTYIYIRKYMYKYVVIVLSLTESLYDYQTIPVTFNTQIEVKDVVL